ncbi:glycoside hydrolase [Dyella sp. 2RAB6]|uniref:glycoside hydrolase n=1 Tax=Dyella sp. 2RAB6 TaxID=3232992 RepID=UPI003F92090B
MKNWPPIGAGVVLIMLSLSARAADVVLRNDAWRITLDTATLALTAEPAGESPVRLSTGGPARSVDDLRASPEQASWRWGNGDYQVSAGLAGSDLTLAIKARAAGILPLLRQPAAAIGDGLIFPLAEGHYIPSGNKDWQGFLLDRYAQFDTSEDLSLPLWGLDRGRYSLTWILQNPFNNRARFTLDGAGLALSLDHEFTTLNLDQPMTLLLHLGPADPLAGSKRYRELLVSEGRYETLARKITQAPGAAKLIGASHIYLWDGGLLSTKDIADWERFVALLNGHGALASELRHGFEKEARSILAQAKGPRDAYLRQALIRNVNEALASVARARWQNEETPDMRVLVESYGELRSQFALAFAGAVTPDPTQWGGGTSVATMTALRNAGLPKLWIGLGEGWEPGLWHPEAVQAGVKAGYLVAPYDSYETALQAGDNPSWATAHLGGRANRDCAVVLKDGTLRAGFNQSGHYTSPDCVRPLMQARVPAMLSKVPFNSWFIDSYATGMVYDSYRPGASISQAQYAAGAEASMHWITDILKLPAGSEDGKASTNSGTVFAHGMQTPVIAWGDVDMRENKASPYYLGPWYPPEQPEIFFKEVPLKDAYSTVYFDPRMRLPLFQAVFHGSVITTHHWEFDSLKLSNVRMENELAQLLYNVPPLYHLSVSSLSRRLPIIKRQDAFFRPLHEHLATQKLVGFQWLTPDRLVQQTSFEDGTVLIANFSTHAFQMERSRIDPHSIVALLPGKAPSAYQVAEMRYPR